MSAWTPDKEGLLKVLWAQGLSARDIAAKLGGGLSRNAVIGKRIRMGLPDRATDARSYRTNKPRTQLAAPKKPKPVVPKLKREALPKPKAPVRGPESVRWIDHTFGQCEMFCAGEEGALGFVCGRAVDWPNSFCPECRSLCYLPPEKWRAA